METFDCAGVEAAKMPTGLDEVCVGACRAEGCPKPPDEKNGDALGNEDDPDLRP